MLQDDNRGCLSYLDKYLDKSQPRVFLKPTTLQSWAQVSESYRDTGPARCDGGGCELSIRGFGIVRLHHRNFSQDNDVKMTYPSQSHEIPMKYHSSPSRMSTCNIMSKFRVSRERLSTTKMLRPMVLQTWLVTLPLRQILFRFLRLGWVICKENMPNTPNLHSCMTVYSI